MFYRKYPIEAAKDLLKIELVWFQRVTLRMMWTLRFVLVLMGRGIGKTWLNAVFLILYAMLYPKSKLGVIAPVLRQTSYTFDYIEEFYHDSPFVKASTRKISRAMNREYIEFHNGSFIEGLPLGDGTKVRGRRYNVAVTEEHAQISEEILRLVVYPFMNVKRRGIDNKLIISGTAYYPWNHYYRQYLLFNVMSEKRPNLYGFVEYDYEDLLCLDDPPYQFDVENLKMSMSETTRDEWMMENKNLFPIESAGFFPAKLIDDCTPHLQEGSPVEIKGRADKKYAMGIDAARVEGGDNFVIVVLRLDAKVKRVAHCIALNGASYPKMVETIRQICLDFNIVRIHLDSQGGGMAIYDLLAQPWAHSQTGAMMLPILDMDDKDNIDKNGLKYLQIINPTRPLNSEMFHNLKAEMEHTRLLFPITQRRHASKSIERVVNDINQIKQELLMLIAEGKGAYYTFEAPSGRKKDRAVALALANNAAKSYLSIEQVVKSELPMGLWAQRS
jgi:hypothetical protein